MFKRLVPTLLLAGCSATAATTGAPADPPRVVVLVTVDQLRADLVTRYDAFYTDGFRRLIDQGAHFDGIQDHGVTVTAAGHATLSTGVYPARHGIVGNDWMQVVGEGFQSMHNVRDSSVAIVGFPDRLGVSPRNLLRDGLANWVVDADSAAKVVSISGKDRGAILPAARTRGQVYWYDGGSGRFLTSTWYRDSYPAWVTRFETEVLPTLLDSVWESKAPAAAKLLTQPDSSTYEEGGEFNHFPHRYSAENRGGRVSLGSWNSSTPTPDRIVVEMAKVAMRENGIGQDEVTDFVGISFSQTDAIGHGRGALSREQLENLLHLDGVLGDLLRFLDEEIGEGRWVLALSADHGANTMPEFLASQGVEGARRLTRADQERMAAAVDSARKAAPAGQEQQAIAEALAQIPFVMGAYTRTELAATGAPRDSLLKLLRRSYHPERMSSDLARNGVAVVGRPEIYMSASSAGSGHGTPWYYDRSVPVIFIGAGVAPGRRTQIVRTVDVAPTLAALARIPVPGDLDGVVVLP